MYIYIQPLRTRVSLQGVHRRFNGNRCTAVDGENSSAGYRTAVTQVTLSLVRSNESQPCVHHFHASTGVTPIDNSFCATFFEKTVKPTTILIVDRNKINSRSLLRFEWP